MDEKDKFDAYMRQAEFNIKRFDERRGYSWKVALGFWGTPIVAAAIFGGMDPSPILLCLLPVAFLPIALHVFWLKNVFAENNKDKSTAYAARDMAYKLAKLKYEKPEYREQAFFENWAVQFQLAVTTLLSLGALIFIFMRLLELFPL